MEEYEITIDTCLKYGIITLTVIAENEAGARKKAIDICSQRYHDEYLQSQKEAVAYRLKYKQLHGNK